MDAQARGGGQMSAIAGSGSAGGAGHASRLSRLVQADATCARPSLSCPLCVKEFLVRAEASLGV